MSNNLLGNLYIIVAPSGAGKTSLVKAILERMQHICVSISHTTRPMRPGEADGKDYFFTERDDFDKLIAEGAFLEHAMVFDNHYGTSRDWVLSQLRAGIDVILEIDWQGASQIKATFGDAISVFILPPTLETLRTRLIMRGQDSDTVIEKRLSQAQLEMSHHNECDYIVINDDFSETLEQLCAIIVAGRLTHDRQVEHHADLIAELLA